MQGDRGHLRPVRSLPFAAATAVLVDPLTPGHSDGSNNPCAVGGTPCAPSEDRIGEQGHRRPGNGEGLIDLTASVPAPPAANVTARQPAPGYRLVSRTARAAGELGLLNRGPATSIHSLPSECRAVAATWARAVCNFASSRHHMAPGTGLVAGRGLLQEPLGLAVMIWAIHGSPAVVRPLPRCQCIKAHLGSRNLAGTGSIVLGALRPGQSPTTGLPSD